MRSNRSFGWIGWAAGGAVVAASALMVTASAHAFPDYREAFFTVYPQAVGTALDSVPGNSTHCGVCHYSFWGGGPRNPYGAMLQAALPGFPDTPEGYQQAILSIEPNDAEGDGYPTATELTNLVGFSNTPTFPGLDFNNVGQVQNVTDPNELLSYLVPGVIVDIHPPSVTVLDPNGGDVLVGNAAYTIHWVATDDVEVTEVELYASYDNGTTYAKIAEHLANTGSYQWFVPNRPTTLGFVMVVAFDAAGKVGADTNDAGFEIQPPGGSILPTTLRDFDMPGTQPFEGGQIFTQWECAGCHGFYGQPDVEPFRNWEGSMMAYASRDPMFEAAMTIANQDAADAGDLCLRCHIPAAWVRGRSVPTDGSAALSSDMHGVSCDICHRLVDPIFDPNESPPVDQDILAALMMPPTGFGNGMYVFDPNGVRRGPYDDADLVHQTWQSPFHREAALCGTCHDVSNPALESDGMGNYVPNALDAPAADVSPEALMPVERTYSEWLHSAYNSPTGVYAPQFGGNREWVSVCQDCHMRAVTGQGCVFPEVPVRDDLGLHDLTGGSTWMLSLLPGLFPGEIDPNAIAGGIDRARYLLRNAATLEVGQQGAQLKVRVTNEGGHKLPTGYPEGRRVWINVKFYSRHGALISESGAYDPNTGILTEDAEAKIYRIKLGPDETLAPAVGLDAEPSFHFVLSNKVYQDNRIPPRGFSNTSFATFGGAPVDYSYADGQYWDDTHYQIPPGAGRAEVTLYYQSTNKAYMEFLRDENTTDAKGQLMYDLWQNNDRCPPEIMATKNIPLVSSIGPKASGQTRPIGKRAAEPIAP